jgi:hypothetical protein
VPLILHSRVFDVHCYPLPCLALPHTTVGSVPQKQYDYYEFRVSSISGQPIRFTLNPSDSSDLDLYVVFRNKSSTGSLDDRNIPGNITVQ